MPIQSAIHSIICSTRHRGIAEQLWQRAALFSSAVSRFRAFQNRLDAEALAEAPRQPIAPKPSPAR